MSDLGVPAGVDHLGERRAVGWRGVWAAARKCSVTSDGGPARASALWRPRDTPVGEKAFRSGMYGAITVASLGGLTIMIVGAPADPAYPGQNMWPWWRFALAWLSLLGIIAGLLVIARLRRWRARRLAEAIFAAPPTWPSPPPGFRPLPGWAPDPSWPAAPDGWQFWRRPNAGNAAT